YGRQIAAPTVICGITHRTVRTGVRTLQPSQSALPPTALPKGEPRMSYTNPVHPLASPFGRGVMR
ncbi:MAG: hypothetical protein FWH14_07890, partial [Oscillospiraceae bacterium]|nr:hypothetical protein [Oscillospiraceae bacterium]